MIKLLQNTISLNIDQYVGAQDDADFLNEDKQIHQ